MSWGELKDKKENTEVGTWKLKVAERERERERLVLVSRI